MVRWHTAERGIDLSTVPAHIDTLQIDCGDDPNDLDLDALVSFSVPPRPASQEDEHQKRVQHGTSYDNLKRRS